MATDAAGVISVAETFDQLLRAQLQEHLISQERAAEMAGVSVSSMKRYLSGKCTPLPHNAANIAATFRLDRRRVAEAIVASEGNNDDTTNGIQDGQDEQEDGDGNGG